MKTFSASLALGACALILASPGSAAVDFGANDDTGKFLAGASSGYFGQMAALGMRQNVITLKWDPAAPMTIPDKVFLDAAMPLAQAAGIKVVLTLYGAKPTTFTGDGGTAEAFAAWAAQVARTYPGVKTFIVGNEPNQPRFWRPQFDAAGAQASAAAFGPVLAAAYDALKAVDPSVQVVGVGLSPRGNDRPDAASNISTSPVRFLNALGRWYRGSGRTRPIMDAFSFHPYPNANTDPLARGYTWPNAGLPNLDRLKQGLHDAFAGSSQPGVQQGLKLFLDEVGWQVDTAGNGAYSGAENVAVTTEENQAQIYSQLVQTTSCDPSIASVNIFGFRDQAEREGFQAGPYRKDGSARPSAETLRQAIAAGCTGSQVSWSPASGVVGAGAKFGDSSPKPAKQKAWQANATAAEDAVAQVGLFKVKNQTGRRCTPGRVDFLQIFSGKTPSHELVFDDEFEVKAGFTPLLRLDKKALRSGCYFYAMILEAVMNEERQSTFASKGFIAGPAVVKKKK